MPAVPALVRPRTTNRPKHISAEYPCADVLETSSGKLIVDAVLNRDYAVVQGVVLVTATTYILLNLLADIGYILVNPRLRA